MNFIRRKLCLCTEDPTNAITDFETLFKKMTLIKYILSPVVPGQKLALYKFNPSKIPLSRSLKSHIIIQLSTTCNNALNPNYVRECCDSSDMLLVIDTTNITNITENSIQAFAFINSMLLSDFNSTIISNCPGTPTNIQPAPAGSVVYIQTICSNKKAASHIIEYLKCLKQFDGIALKAIPSSYSYYVKKDFIRTCDLKNSYLAYCNSRINITNNPMQVEQDINNHFDDYAYFEGDSLDSGFLFMTPNNHNCQSGGKGSEYILFKSRYYKIRTDKINHYIYSPKIGEINVNKVKKMIKQGVSKSVKIKKKMMQFKEYKPETKAAIKKQLDLFFHKHTLEGIPKLQLLQYIAMYSTMSNQSVKEMLAMKDEGKFEERVRKLTIKSNILEDAFFSRHFKE